MFPKTGFLKSCATRIAFASEVGAWVDELAHDSLAARAAKVRKLEATPLEDVAKVDDPEQANEQPAHNRRRRTVKLAAVVALIGAATTWALARGARTTSTEGPSLHASTTASSAGPLDEPPSTGDIAPALPRPDEAEPTPTSSVHVTARTIARPGAGAVTNAAPRRSSPKAVPASDCEPPFTVDDLGHKHFKKGCFPR